MNDYNVEIISVNYNTPELIYRQYISIRKYISKTIPIRIIDGSDKGVEHFKDLINSDENFSVKSFGYNIHHGAGMHYGITSSKYRYQLIMDSDSFFVKTGLLDLMLSMFDSNTYGVGQVMDVNSSGINVKRGIKYLHPYCMLISRHIYEQYEPFLNHGAPCINAMISIINKQYQVKSISGISKYVKTTWRGTVSKFGYQLPPAGHTNTKNKNRVKNKI